MCLICIITSKFLVSKKGIGYLILYGSQVFNLSLVISGIFILCIVAALMYYLVSFVEKKVSRKNWLIFFIINQFFVYYNTFNSKFYFN